MKKIITLSITLIALNLIAVSSYEYLPSESENTSLSNNESFTVLYDRYIALNGIVAEAPSNVVNGQIPIIMMAYDTDKNSYHLDKVEIYDEVSGELIDTIDFEGDGSCLGKTYKLFNDSLWYTSKVYNSDVFDSNLNNHKKIKVVFITLPFPCDSDINTERIFEVSEYLLPKLNNWYCGDSHYHSAYTHTFFMGVYGEIGGPIDFTTNALDFMGLDWVAVTDHSNSFTLNDNWDSFVNECSLSNKCLMGEEVNCNYYSGGDSRNHFLAYGINSILEDVEGNHGFGIPSTDTCEKIIDKVNLNGGFGYVAHPYDSYAGGLAFGQWENYSLNFIGLQIWNQDITNPEKGQDRLGNLLSGLNKWKELILSGRKVFISAGSDAHGDFQEFGKEYTCVYAPDFSKSNIFNGLKNGNSYISNNGALKFEITTNGITGILGQTIVGIIGGSATFKIDYNLENSCRLKLYEGILGSNTETIVKDWGFVSGESSKSYLVTLGPGDSYYRAECINSDGSKRIYTNPIWVNVKETEIPTTIGSYLCIPNSAVNGPGWSFYYINNVSLNNGTIDTSGNPAPYAPLQDYPLTTVEKGRTYNLTVNIHNSYINQANVKAWIDFNRDWNITQNEEVDFGNARFEGNHTFDKTITIPDAINSNTVTMRVALKMFSPPSSCDNENPSQTYDYLISIIDPVCTPNFVNASWSPWQNISCLKIDKMNQTRSRIQYDSNNCPGSQNKTIYGYQQTQYCHVDTEPPVIHNQFPTNGIIVPPGIVGFNLTYTEENLKNISLNLRIIDKDIYEVETSSDKLEIGEPIGRVITYINKADLPLLADGEISNEKGTAKYEQFFYFDDTTSSKVTYQEDDNENVGLFFKINSGEVIARYVMNFTTNLVSDVTSTNHLDDVEGKNITILGKTYTITSAVNSSATHTDLTLMNGVDKIELNDGDAMVVNSETISDAAVTIAEIYASGDVSIGTITINMTAEDDLYVPVNGKLSEATNLDKPQVLIGQNWDIAFLGLENTTYETIELKKTTDSKIVLNFQNYNGDQINMPLMYTNVTGVYGGDKAGYELVLAPSLNSISKNQYFILNTADPTLTANSESARSYVVQYKGADKTSDTSPKARFNILGVDSNKEVTLTSAGGCDLKLGGTTFSFSNKTTCTSNDCKIYLTTIDYVNYVPNATTSNYLRTKNNALINITDTNASVDKKGVASSWTVSIVLDDTNRDGDFYTLNSKPKLFTIGYSNNSDGEFGTWVSGGNSPQWIVDPDNNTHSTYIDYYGNEIDYSNPVGSPDSIKVKIPESIVTPKVYITPASGEPTTTLRITNIKNSCPSGINQECLFDVNLTDYTNRKIKYWFKLEDLDNRITYGDIFSLEVERLLSNIDFTLNPSLNFGVVKPGRDSNITNSTINVSENNNADFSLGIELISDPHKLFENIFFDIDKDGNFEADERLNKTLTFPIIDTEGEQIIILQAILRVPQGFIPGNQQGTIAYTVTGEIS